MVSLLRPNCKWYVYMLTNSSSTIPYIGKTNDLERRLRQHNGEISGGAKRTHRALKHNTLWKRELCVSGFIDERAALHFENRFQRERRTVSKCKKSQTALEKGLDALARTMSRDKPTRAALPISSYGIKINFENEESRSTYAKFSNITEIISTNQFINFSIKDMKADTEAVEKL